MTMTPDRIDATQAAPVDPFTNSNRQIRSAYNAACAVPEDLLTAEITAASRHLAALMVRAAALNAVDRGCGVEIHLEQHVTHLRDAFGVGASALGRSDGGAGLMRRVSSSAGHAAQDLADLNGSDRFYQ